MTSGFSLGVSSALSDRRLGDDTERDSKVFVLGTQWDLSLGCLCTFTSRRTTDRPNWVPTNQFPDLTPRDSGLTFRPPEALPGVRDDGARSSDGREGRSSAPSNSGTGLLREASGRESGRVDRVTDRDSQRRDQGVSLWTQRGLYRCTEHGSCHGPYLLCERQ